MPWRHFDVSRFAERAPPPTMCEINADLHIMLRRHELYRAEKDGTARKETREKAQATYEGI